MDEKRHFMDQICTLWMRIAFMDEKRRFMDQICILWTRFALMDEKRIFYGKKKYQPERLLCPTDLWICRNILEVESQKETTRSTGQ